MATIGISNSNWTCQSSTHGTMEWKSKHVIRGESVRGGGEGEQYQCACSLISYVCITDGVGCVWLDMFSYVSSGHVVTMADIHRNLQHHTFPVCDARSSGRFTGTDPEPRPGMSSGHIPGSVSIPFMELLKQHPTLKASKADRNSHMDILDIHADHNHVGFLHLCFISTPLCHLSISPDYCSQGLPPILLLLSFWFLVFHDGVVVLCFEPDCCLPSLSYLLCVFCLSAIFHDRSSLAGYLSSRVDLSDPNAPIVTSCGTGVTACVVALALELLGHRNVKVYDGSWTEWVRTSWKQGNGSDIMDGTVHVHSIPSPTRTPLSLSHVFLLTPLLVRRLNPIHPFRKESNGFLFPPPPPLPSARLGRDRCTHRPIGMEINRDIQPHPSTHHPH